MNALRFSLAHHWEQLAVLRGPERIAHVRLMVRELLDRVEAADVTHDEAALALRAIYHGLEGGR